MTAGGIRVSREWLDLREPADAAARAVDLLEPLRQALPMTGRTVVHDLAAGSGSMGRWLAPRLGGSQHWVLHDRDADLLAAAAHNRPGLAADGAPVGVETRLGDITALRPDDLAGASLITASALLDLLTGEELNGLVALCVGVGCPVLLTLSVVGRVSLTPADPLDAVIAGAFDDHQRRRTVGGRLLGPDAVAAAVTAFGAEAAEVVVHPSPWRLDAADAGLTAPWLAGWVEAAVEQEEALRARAGDYRRRRLADAAAGRLAVIVDHADLLVVPR
jgi:hypothetical protein